MNSQVTKMTAVQELLGAKSAVLSQLSAKRIQLTDELRRVKPQQNAGATVRCDTKLAAGSCESPAKRVEMTHQCNHFSTYLWTAAY